MIFSSQHSSKNEQKNSTLLLWNLRWTCFHLFWKNWIKIGFKNSAPNLYVLMSYCQCPNTFLFQTPSFIMMLILHLLSVSCFFFNFNHWILTFGFLVAFVRLWLWRYLFPRLENRIFDILDQMLGFMLEFLHFSHINSLKTKDSFGTIIL